MYVCVYARWKGEGMLFLSVVGCGCRWSSFLAFALRVLTFFSVSSVEKYLQVDYDTDLPLVGGVHLCGTVTQRRYLITHDPLQSLVYLCRIIYMKI